MNGHRPPTTTHTVSLAQIRRWCNGIAVSPDAVLKRKRVKALIGFPDAVCGKWHEGFRS